MVTFSKDVLRIDPARETERIVQTIRESVLGRLKRRGAVVGLSGGVDSSVVVALCTRAFGKERTLGLFMNEEDSSEDTKRLARIAAEHAGVSTVDENLTPILAALGCYRRRDDAIRSVIPQYGPSYKSKIVLPSVLESETYRIYSVVVEAPDGKQLKARLTPAAYLEIVASTNFKQRTRKMIEYYHADRLVYAVAGTPNLLEYDQGFFVKNGDGAADFKPIAHLYKSQVYQLAAHLGVPEEIRSRPPTTDTYSMPQSQEEFYFSLPYDRMDLCLYAKSHSVPADDVARALELTPEQVQRVFRDIDAKRNAARYLHAPPAVVEGEAPGVS